MKSLKPNGEFIISEELQTTAIFPRAYTIVQAIEELRVAKACGKLVIHLANGGIQKMELVERKEVDVIQP